jgi:glycosyltransferase involved in cell wall biosynthesis
VNIKFFAVDTWACGHFRGELPAREINAQYPNHRMDIKTNIMFSDYPSTHLMIFQRQNKNLENVQFANSRGIATVYEIDDDLWGCPPVFEAYGKKCLKPEESEVIMKACDAITVSTPELADVVQKHIPGKPVHVIPNAIDMEMWDATYCERQIKVSDGTVTIGWMASQSHLMDAPLVGEVLRDLMVEFPQLRLHFIGWLGMQDFMVNLAPFKDRIICGDWVPVSQLAETMKDFDIGLLPLVDHPWNRSKSDLKYLQYSCLGIPSVASPLPCYTRTIEQGCGLIAENNAPAAWYTHLKALIVDEGLRRSVGARARQLVYLKHNIKDQVRVWVDTYERIVKNK